MKKLFQFSKEKKITKKRFIVLFSLLFFLILANLFILQGLTFKRIAQALSGDYAKPLKSTIPPNNQLGLTDWNGLISSWNSLPAEFVARTGGVASAMLDILDMGNHRITNVADPGTSLNDAANKGYVDNAVAGAGGGGDTFTNWGQATCPSGSTPLYSGYAFHQSWNYSGGGEPTCIEYVVGDTPTMGAPTTPTSDALSPVSTADSIQLPSTIPARRMVRCAVCQRDGGTCFEHWGSQSCGGAAGYDVIYTGYGLGGFANRTTNINRHCVDDSNFDGTIPSTSYQAVWYGTSIYSTTNVGLFTPQSYVKCAMCCN
jgi:hypothetical protein